MQYQALLEHPSLRQPSFADLPIKFAGIEQRNYIRAFPSMTREMQKWEVARGLCRRRRKALFRAWLHLLLGNTPNRH